MDNYTIKPGDTLSKIAGQLYGDPAKWRVIAEANRISNPSLIKVGDSLKIPSLNGDSNEASSNEETVRFIQQGKTVYFHTSSNPTNRYLGSTYSRGLFRRGINKTKEFLQNNTALKSEFKLSNSEVNALIATSENEGNLDAINTWDNAFLSFGIFQWTLGVGNDPGELPALMKVLKEKYPETFQKYLGRHGLEISSRTGGVSGYFLLNGARIDRSNEKVPFRANQWAYRFAIAGLDEKVCKVQVLHAINRLNRFYFSPSDRLGGKSLYDVLNSEYAASLLLDNHVNRPAYVVKCVAQAIKNAGTTPAVLAAGTTEDQMKVLNAYLEVRQTFGRSPMTDALNRGNVTRRYLNSGAISGEKGSFVSNRAQRG